MKTPLRYPNSDEVWHLHHAAIYLSEESWWAGEPELSIDPGWSREVAVTAYVKVSGPNRRTHEHRAPMLGGGKGNYFRVKDIDSLRFYQRHPSRPVTSASSGLHRRVVIAELRPDEFYCAFLWIANREQWFDSGTVAGQMVVEIRGEEPVDASTV